jgi:hypothetical protein
MIPFAGPDDLVRPAGAEDPASPPTVLRIRTVEVPGAARRASVRRADPVAGSRGANDRRGNGAKVD